MSVKVLQEQGKVRVIQIAQNLKRAGKQVTGKTIRSLNSKTKKTSTGYELTIFGAKWILTLEPPGRRPTSTGKRGRLYGLILDWVKARGFSFPKKSQKTTAFLISRKIDREGIKVPNSRTPAGLLRDGEDQWYEETKQKVLQAFIDDEIRPTIRKAL